MAPWSWSLRRVGVCFFSDACRNAKGGRALKWATLGTRY